MNQNEFEAPVDKTSVNVPSVKAIVCPKCKRANLRIIRIQGAHGNTFGGAFAMRTLMDKVIEKAKSNTPMEYKCEDCGIEFEAYPIKAMPEEILDTPCTVNFHRLGALTGMAMYQLVWLNGICVGAVGNKESITFPTYVKHNVVVVTDHFGIAFKGHFTFEAESGGTQEIKFKRKFIIE